MPSAIGGNRCPVEHAAPIHTYGQASPAGDPVLSPCRAQSPSQPGPRIRDDAYKLAGRRHAPVVALVHVTPLRPIDDAYHLIIIPQPCEGPSCFRLCLGGRSTCRARARRCAPLAVCSAVPRVEHVPLNADHGF